MGFAGWAGFPNGPHDGGTHQGGRRISPAVVEQTADGGRRRSWFGAKEGHNQNPWAMGPGSSAVAIVFVPWFSSLAFVC